MNSRNVLVTGGGGYVGCILVPKLLDQGYRVAVLDCLLFGRKPLAGFVGRPGFVPVRGDIRDFVLLQKVLVENRIDSVIHLAAISNDPCSELSPEVTKAVNYDAVSSLVAESKAAGVTRFINASSATVYGIKQDQEVTEDLIPDPITIYGKYKLLSEDVVNRACSDSFIGVNVRSATACGYSARMRLDLVLNTLTHHAVQKGLITVFGGEQMRPLVHVDDLAEVYGFMLTADPRKINGRSFNVCKDNYQTLHLARLVKQALKRDIEIRQVPTEDKRSYHLNADRLRNELGFVPACSMEQAVLEMAQAMTDGRMTDTEDPIYYNIRTMKAAGFQ